MKNLSSGTIVAMLVLSGLLLMVPLATTVHAAQNASYPTVTATPNVVYGVTPTLFSVSVTNPITNAYAITEITFSLPTGWAFSGVPTCGTGVGNGPYLNQVVVTSSSAIECTSSGIGNQLNPGFTTVLNLEDLAGPGSVSTSPAVVASISTSVIDAGSSPAAYVGPTMTEYDAAATTVSTVTLSPAVTDFVAGTSPYTVTATLSSGQAGVPVVFSMTNGEYPTSGFTATLTPASGFTGTSGTLSTVFVPSNYAGDHTTITATVGTTSTLLQSGEVLTVPAAPSAVSFYLESPTLFPGTHYISAFHASVCTVSSSTVSGAYDPGTTAGAVWTWSVSDQFGNSVAGAAGLDITSGTLTAATSSNGPAYLSPLSAGACSATESTGSAANGGVPGYLQPGIYGTVGKLTQTVSGTYNSAPFAVSGFSGNIVTGTFAGSSPVPYYYNKGVLVSNDPSTIPAGNSFTVSSGVLTDSQQGVPVTIYAETCLTTAQTGYFTASGLPWVTVFTNSSGIASASFYADTTAGDQVTFYTNVTAPIDSNSANALGPSHASADCVATVAGTPSTLVIETFYSSELPSNGGDGDYLADTCSATSCDLTGTTVVAGNSYAVDVLMADKFGNPVVSTQSAAIQVSLSTTSPTVLSATTLYIYSGCADTVCSPPVGEGGEAVYGPSLLTVPSSMAVGSKVTLTATGVPVGVEVTGTLSLTVASPLPTFNTLTPTYSGSVFYSNSQTVIFSGWANVSSALPTITDTATANIALAAVQFRINSGTWQSAAIAHGAQVKWSVAATFPVGLNTIQFRANDSASTPDVYTAPVSQVLIDTTPPTITFPTTTTVNTGSVTLTVSDSLGDLNTTSIQAWWGTTAIPAASITVSGSNTVGSNSVFTVTVAGLTPGTNTLKVTASDYAGNTATSSQTFTVTILQIDTFTLSTPLTQTTESGLNGVSASLTNNGVSADAQVWFQLVNSQNSVILGPIISGQNFAAGATNTFFFGFGSNLAHGTYTAQVFVRVGGNAYSQTFTLTVTV